MANSSIIRKAKNKIIKEFIKDPLNAYENKIFCKGAPLKTGVIWNKDYIEEGK